MWGSGREAALQEVLLLPQSLPAPSPAQAVMGGWEQGMHWDPHSRADRTLTSLQDQFFNNFVNRGKAQRVAMAKAALRKGS